MAALNASGYDVELGSQYHPVREAARKLNESVDPDLIARMREFYKRNKGNQSDDAQLSKYISLAVSLNDPPAFSLATREEVVPPDARSILGFAELLREYYQKARISQRWSGFRPQYESGISQLGPTLRDLIVRTEAYLRIPLGSVFSRTMSIYVELAAPLNSVHVRSYQDSYYVVLGGGTLQKFDEVRHAYLHFHLDNLVARNVTRIQNGGVLLSLILKAEGVELAYTSDFHIMTTESLIRAIELRMDRVPEAEARHRIDQHYRSGLLLVPRFYDALQSYEQNEAGIRDYFVEIAKETNVEHEHLRFQQTFHKIPIPQKADTRGEVPVAPVPAPVNPTRELLKEGEAAMAANDLPRAKSAFEKVLANYDPNNGAAFYGLALIAGREDDKEQAREFFAKAVRTDSAEPSMKVWAFIYLGRIFDLECNREQALAYYQEAFKTGDNTRNAQAVAREGLARPYGDGCR